MIARLSFLLALALPGAVIAAIPDYGGQPFSLPDQAQGLIAADVTGDGRKDLIATLDQQIRVYFHDAQGFDFETGYVDIDFPGEAVGWDLSSNYSTDGRASLIALIDGSEVWVWHFAAGEVRAPERLQSGLPGFLSKGISRLFFSRDINDDGREDLVIPGAGRLHLYIAMGDGSYQAGITVFTDSRLRTVLAPGQLERRTGQAIRIPLMDLRDVNSDGRADLISRTDERLDVFLASDNLAAYFSDRPAYSLDIAEVEARLGEFDVDNLDFSNLTGVLALTHEELLEDVDADGIDDLLLREGGKVSLFTGTPDGMDFSQPRQVLRSGGNVLSTFLFDENEDGLKDLWLWRVEPISVGDIFVWLALSGSVAVEAFVYPNDGERFARRPARKLTIELKFPSVIRLANAYRDVSSAVREAEQAPAVPTRRADVDGQLEREDLLVLMNNQVQVFLNTIEVEAEQDRFLGRLGYNRERDNYEIDIGDIVNDIAIGANPDLERTRDTQADLILELGDGSGSDVIAVELNGDGRDDILVFGAEESSHIQGMLLLSK